jgi:hypothetical protein
MKPIKLYPNTHYKMIDNFLTPMKYCGSCKQNKSVVEFAKNVWKKDGLQTSCKGCQTKYGQARYQNTKEAYKDRNNKLKVRNQLAVYDYLKTKSCVDCGVSDPVVLTFDHVRGDKLGTISDMVKHSWGLDTIFAEIEKCEIRCFNCHMRKDSRRRGGKKWNALNSPLDDSFSMSGRGPAVSPQ